MNYWHFYFFFPLEMRNLSFSWWRGIQEIQEISKTEKIRPLSLADPSAQGICTSAAARTFSLLFLLFSVKSSSFIQTTANTTEKTIVSKHEDNPFFLYSFFHTFNLRNYNFVIWRHKLKWNALQIKFKLIHFLTMCFWKKPKITLLCEKTVFSV